MNPITPAAARERANALVTRQKREWAAFGGVRSGGSRGVAQGDRARRISEEEDCLVVSPRLDLPLHPPTERAALSDIRGTVAWVDSWRGVSGVEWQNREWASAGRQELPVRLTLNGADEIARFAGRATEREWGLLRDRAQLLFETFGSTGELREAIRRHGTELGRLPQQDFDLFLGVLRWLVANPVSGYRLRQVPVPGMHTKWLASHRAIVEALHTAITGRDSLGLVVPGSRMRVRFLDPQLRPGGLDDVTATVEELAQLALPTLTVLIVENLETLLALPDWPGVVALHGAGYAVADTVPRVPWVSGSTVVYWGDLDVDGLAILHALRARGLAVRSVLMDEGTYELHETLWVDDPGFQKPRDLADLTDAELRTYARIIVEGGRRLEQERIPWAYALTQLEQVLGVTAAGTRLS